jgi:hypothetical protein
MKYGENLTKEVIIMPYKARIRKLLKELEELIKNEDSYKKLGKNEQEKILSLVVELGKFLN